MAEFQPSNFYASFTQGLEQGRERAAQSRLARLYQQAYDAPEEQRGSILAQMAGIDPRAAQFQQRVWGGGEQAQQRNVVVSPGGALVNQQTGQELYARPFAPSRPVWDSARGVFVPAPNVGGAGGPTHNDMEADIALANDMIAAGIPDAQVDTFIRARGQRVPQAGAANPLRAIPVEGVEPKVDPPKFQSRKLSAQEIAEFDLSPGTVAFTTESGKPDIISKPDARQGTGSVMPLSAGEAAKVRTQFKETKDALNTFKAFDQALKDIPSGPGLLLDGKAQGRLGTSYNNARAALRILYNTGVLQPGELPMLESALRDPTSFRAVMDPRARPQIQEQLNELYRTITRGIENQVVSYPQIFNQQRYEQSRATRSSAQPSAPSVPQPGQVESGYRFKGGDPADPNSWEQL